MKDPSCFAVRSLLLVVTLVLWAESVDSQEAVCGGCEGAGVVGCGDHKRRELAWEDNALFCSVLYACRRCAGTGSEDCTRCESESQLSARRASVDELAKEMRKIEEKLGRPVRVAESEHFVVVCELPKMKVGSSRRTAHELLHLYIDRLERLFVDYLSIFAIDDDQFAEKPRVFLWSSPEDHQRAGESFCGYAHPGPVYQRGVVCTLSVLGGKRPLDDDEALHRTVVHHLAHGIMNLQRPAAWTGNTKAGWADAGIAHWFEDLYFGTTGTFCYVDVLPDARFKSGRWRQDVRKLVSKGSSQPLTGIVQLDTQELDREKHVIAFSLIDYLMARDAHELNELLRRLRARSPARDAIKAVYGEDLETFEASWKAWVLETYPKR